MGIENRRFRCHGSIVLEQCAKTIGAIVAYILFNIGEILFDDTDLESEGFAIMLVVFGVIALGLLVSLAIALVKWRKTTIVLEEDAVIWERKTVNKKTLTIGIGSVSSINIERNLFERIIGTAKLKIDTSSLSTADSTDVKFVFKYDDALRYKEYLEEKVRLCENVSVQKEGVSIGQETSAKKEETQGKFESKALEIIKHCVYDLSLVGLLAGLVVTVYGIREIVYTIGQGIANLKELIFAGTLVITFGYVTLYSLIGKLIRFWGLTVARKGKRLYITYGLFSVKEYVIPVDKINALHIRQTLVGRLCKKYNVTMECVGVADEDNETAQVTLSLRYEDVVERLCQLLPEYPIPEMEMLEPLSKKATYHKAMRMIIYTGVMVLFAIGGKVALWITKTGEIAPVYRNVIAGAVIAGYVLILLIIFLQKQVEAIGFGKMHVFVKTGIAGTDLMIVPYKKIQYVAIKSSPLSKVTGLETGSINILAGTLETKKALPYAKTEVLEELIGKIH